MLQSFGIGQIISSDFPNALKGDLPTESIIITEFMEKVTGMH